MTCRYILFALILIAGCSTAPEGRPCFVPVEEQNTVEHFAPIPPAFSVKTEETDECRVRTAINISYAKRGKVKDHLTSLDIYAPREGVGMPVMVFIHGGAWAKGDKAHGGAELKGKWFTEQGYLFVSVNYRLFPDVRFREQAGDIAAALSWIAGHINKFGGDPGNIFIMGHSAGAHLAALISIDQDYLKGEGKTLSLIKGVILLDGAGYDIPMQVNILGGEASRKLYTAIFGKDQMEWEAASPSCRVASEQIYPPFLIFHAGRRPASEFQALGLAKKLRDAGGKAQVIHEPLKNHATINREIGLPQDSVTESIMEFLSAQKH